MVSSIFIHRDRLLSYSSIGSTTKPRMRCKLLTEWKPGFFFFGGDEMNPTLLSGATLKFELKDKATGSPLLYTTTFTTSDDGHHADFAAVDSAGLRALIGDQVSVIVTGEIEWTIEGRARRATVDVLVENAFVRPDDVAPNPVAEASDAWLDERAVRFDREQDLSEGEQLQARTNIGIDGDLGVTDHGALTGLGDNDHPQYALAATMTAELAGKAATSHTHAQSEVTGLEAALAGKAATSHTHAQSEVTGLEAALAGKAATSHTHAQSEVTGLEAALAGKAATSHTHAQSEVTGLVDALAGKEAAQTAASQAEAEAGTETAIRKFSPQRIKQAIEALAPGGGGASISTPRVLYVETTGNDGTAEIGNPSLPYATVQAAFDDVVEILENFVIHLGVGDFSASVYGWPARIAVIGSPYSSLTISVSNGLTLYSDGNVLLTISGTGEFLGGAGPALNVFRGRIIAITSTGAVGTTGDPGAPGDSETPGGPGGTGGIGGVGGPVSLIHCDVASASSVGGAGGNGGSGGADNGAGAGAEGDMGPAGDYGNIYLSFCRVGSVECANYYAANGSIETVVSGSFSDLGGNSTSAFNLW